MRSKSSWYEHGEKSSKHFLNLEKNNKVKAHVRTLIFESGIQVNDPIEIMCKVKDFCSKLHTRRITKIEKNIWITQVGSIYEGLPKSIVTVAKVS